MKKLLTLCFLAAMAISANAQFKLTPSGLVPADDPEKGYIVLEYDSLSASEFYNNAMVYVNSIYRSPKDVANCVENVSINISAESEVVTRRPNMRYNLIIYFKNGKVRINNPIVKFWSQGSYGYNEWDAAGYFKEDGSVKGFSAKVVTGIENYYNDWIAGFRDKIENDVIEEEW